MAQEQSGEERLSDAGTGPYKDFTDKEKKRESLKDYANNYYASNASVTTMEIQTSDFNKVSRIIYPTANDSIVDYVPQELFRTVNTTLHIGKEYGFYIDTVQIGTIVCRPYII